jgi:hypothetical protein
VKETLDLPLLDEAKIISSTKVFQKNNPHLTLGRIGHFFVILKRVRRDNKNEQKEPKNFYALMDAFKEKIRQLAAEIGDDPSPEEEETMRTQLRPLAGLRHIAPIIGGAKIPKEVAGKNYSSLLSVLPLIPGSTPAKCIAEKRPPYDTPSGLPRNGAIALDLCLQLIRANIALCTCGYVQEDLNLKNMIITEKNSSFSLKLIDWEKLHKMDGEDGKNNNGCDFFGKPIPSLLFGLPYTSIREIDQIPTDLYSPRFITALKERFGPTTQPSDPHASRETFLLSLEELFAEEKLSREKSEKE